MEFFSFHPTCIKIITEACLVIGGFCETVFLPKIRGLKLRRTEDKEPKVEMLKGKCDKNVNNSIDGCNFLLRVPGYKLLVIY